MQELVDVHFPQAEGIRLVVDNLNTHTPAALYETFAPAEARRRTRKLEFHYTSKPGSWLNMAECEFAALTKQCLARRVPDVTTLRREIAAWQARRNRAKTRITWRFGTSDARVKLHRLYPATTEQEQSPVLELERVASSDPLLTCQNLCGRPLATIPCFAIASSDRFTLTGKGNPIGGTHALIACTAGQVVNLALTGPVNLP
jgi:hypothetical protein